MAGHVRTLVPNGQIFIARWNFRRAIRDGTSQFPKGVCTVGVGGLGAAILFGQVLGALLEKFVRHRGNSQSLSFDFARWSGFHNEFLDRPKIRLVPLELM